MINFILCTHRRSWEIHLPSMSLEEEDDFWNSSGVKAFNFDDEDQLANSNITNSNVNSSYAIAPSSTSSSSIAGFKTLGSILAAKPLSNEPFLKPSMIMCNDDKIEQLIEYLDDDTFSRQISLPKQDPKTYIRDVVDKRIPTDFSSYKSKRDKLLLLDCAICCSDGNAITAVTIFISKTLKTSIFIEELKKRPMAVDHYINYLEMTGRSRELREFHKQISNTT